MAAKIPIRNLAVFALLAALVFLAFGGALRCDFVRFDDHGFVYENPMVLAGLTKAGIRWACTAVYQQWWLPALWMSYMADVEWFGAGPFGFHLTNLLLHAANAGLLFWILFRLTGFRWRSLAAAALWAVHPLRVESVVWITERKDVLSGLFFFLALLAYVRHAERPRFGSLVPVFGALLLGLMAKASVVVLPALLLLLDAWPLRRAELAWTPAARKAWFGLTAEKIPLFLLSGIFTAINLHTHTNGTGAAEGLSALHRLALLPGNVWTYLRLTFWPADLGVFYPANDLVSAGGALLALAGLGAVTFLCARAARRRPYLLFGWAWFLVALLPVLRGIRLGNAAYADRFTYLPAIGLATALAWGAAEFAAAAGGRGRKLAAALGAALVLALAFAARVQTGYWRDSETLFRRALAVTERNADIHFNLANWLAREGRWREAGEEYRATLRIVPDYGPALNNLAWALAAEPTATPDEAREAQALALRAIERAGGENAALLNTLERAQAAAGDFAGAAESARKALALAEQAGHRELAGKIRWRLGLYEAKRPKAD